MIAVIPLIGLFIILGILFSNGKGSFLIAGYNTMPEKEKANYDTVALCKFMGKMMFILCFSMVFWALGDTLESGWLFTFGVVIFAATIAFLLVYANTGNRFRK